MLIYDLAWKPRPDSPNYVFMPSQSAWLLLRLCKWNVVHVSPLLFNYNYVVDRKIHSEAAVMLKTDLALLQVQWSKIFCFYYCLYIECSQQPTWLNCQKSHYQLTIIINFLGLKIGWTRLLLYTVGFTSEQNFKSFLWITAKIINTSFQQA